MDGLLLVVKSLDKVTPIFVLMNLIKNKKLACCWQLSRFDHFPRGVIIPVQIGRVGRTRRRQKGQRIGRFPNLPWATDKDHFVIQIVFYLRIQVPYQTVHDYSLVPMERQGHSSLNQAPLAIV